MGYVELLDVCKDYRSRDGTAFSALAGVNLQIEQGEFVSIVGHSGCGKSTVLSMLAGLVPVSRGEIRVDGEAVHEPGPGRMVVFQNHSLLPWLSLRQNVQLAVTQAHRGTSKARQREIVAEHLEMVHLTRAADQRPDQVSGGMKQRCGIARAFATQPKLLLLDEPFGALDAFTRASLQDELMVLWAKERVTVVMITHDIDEALLLSDRIVMMSNGPAAKVAEIMRVELARPRNRTQVLDTPIYYRQRDELRYFLNKAKRDKLAPPSPPQPATTTRAPVRGGELEKQELVLGYVPLLDCAPLIVAQAEGIFGRHGLRVTLSREPSWKAVSDGIREGRLDAAQMVAGMPLSETLGTNGRPAFPMSTAMTLSRGGNAITLSRRLYDRGVRDRAGLHSMVSERRFLGLPPLVFGMVHPASMHNLLLRAWLGEGDIDPDRDVNLLVIPPPQMVANLEQGSISGYCVGEPWNRRAVREGLGFICATDAEIWRDHPEKVLGVSRSWAKRNPRTHLALVSSLLTACALCDRPDFRSRRLPQLLRQVVGGKTIDFAGVLSGPYERGDGRSDSAHEFVVFNEHHANLCRINEIYWILGQLIELEVCRPSLPPEQLIADVYLEALLREAGANLGQDIGPQKLAPLQIAAVPPIDPGSLMPGAAHSSKAADHPGDSWTSSFSS
jgi:nitrate/nitrite transport system ATP-binding protein